VGSAACRKCHEKNFTRWSQDWHARALNEARAPYVVGQFANGHFQGASTEAWMEKTGNEYFMRTRDDRGVLAGHRVSWVIGGKRMQDAVTVFDDGRWQVLPVYFHVTGGGMWVDYNEAKQGVVDSQHPFFWTNFRRTANKECIECHATGVDVRYDRVSHRWSTAIADAGVSCEACHGPGAKHAETKDPADIVQPADVDDEVELAICGQCHGPREPLFPALDRKDRFLPGHRYDDKYQALVIVDGRDRSGEYFADGRPSSSSFEYQALLQSRCHLKGGATCLTCHTAPHQLHRANEIRGDVDASCRKCHSAIASLGAAHTHHPAQVACVACHMPNVVSGVLDKFADHTIDIPNPRNTIRHDTPNACGVCHADWKNEEHARTMAEWWPHIDERLARRSRLADAIDEKTSGSSLAPLRMILGDRAEAALLRGAAAQLLAQRFPKEATSVLVPLLSDASPVVRADAIEALGYVNARDAADVIARHIDDPALQVRENAALVLASVGDLRGEAALAKLAHDSTTGALFRPHVMLSIAAANRGDLETASKEIDAALALAPYVPDAIVFRADLDARRGDLAAARAELQEALRFNPKHRGALARLNAMR
jgi:tetratricopeptide (TPR) repeat protein